MPAFRTRQGELQTGHAAADDHDAPFGARHRDRVNLGNDALAWVDQTAHGLVVDDGDIHALVARNAVTNIGESPAASLERPFGISKRLPISQFFSISSILIAVLAVVLVGKGMAALQEAGWVHATPVVFPRIDVLGVLPTWQTLLAQALVLALVLVAYFANTRPMASDRHAGTAPT